MRQRKMVKQLIQLAQCLLLSMCVWPTTSALACGSMPAPKLTVRVVPVLFTQDVSKSYKELSRLNEDTSTRTVGLTTVHYSVEMTADEEQIECSPLETVVEITPKDKTVYIGAEFVNTKCVFDQIKEHEGQHVLIVNSFEDSLDYKLQLKWLWLTAANLSRDQIQADLMSYVKELLSQLTKDQQRLDSDEEYLKAGLSCDSALNKFLGRGQ